MMSMTRNQTVRRAAACLVAVASLTACSSGGGSPAPAPDKTTVSPISQADLTAVVASLCMESPTKIWQVLVSVHTSSPARFKQTMGALEAQCPDTLTEVMRLLNGVGSAP